MDRQAFSISLTFDVTMYQVLCNLGFWWNERRVKVWGSEHLGEFCPTDKVTLKAWITRRCQGLFPIG